MSTKRTVFIGQTRAAKKRHYDDGDRGSLEIEIKHLFKEAEKVRKILEATNYDLYRLETDIFTAEDEPYEYHTTDLREAVRKLTAWGGEILNILDKQRPTNEPDLQDLNPLEAQDHYQQTLAREAAEAPLDLTPLG